MLAFLARIRATLGRLGASLNELMGPRDLANRIVLGRKPFTFIYGFLLLVDVVMIGAADIINVREDVVVLAVAGAPFVLAFLIANYWRGLKLPEAEERKVIESFSKLTWTFVLGVTLSALAERLKVPAALQTPGFFIATLIGIASYALFVDLVTAIVFGVRQQDDEDSNGARTGR